MTAILLIIVIVLILISGVFVSAEFSFITVNRSSVERLSAKGDRRAQGVASALRTLSTQLSGAQVGITITNLAIGLLAEPSIAHLLESPLNSVNIPGAAVPGISVTLGVLLATFATMIFGELVPKNLAIARPMRTARTVQGFQRSFSWCVKLPIHVLNGSANFILRKLGVAPQEELASARSADELNSLVRRSAEKGTLPKETALMLERSMAFDDLTALDVMTPRIRMRTVSAQDSASDIMDLARRTGLSRFPVTGKNQDDIVGVVHIKKAIAISHDQRESVKAAQLMSRPHIVPSSIQLDSLLDSLRSGGLQMAIVIDEFGGTDGLVTMEDLLEELVGDVRDEHDRAAPNIRKRAEGVWALSGLLRPDEITQQLGVVIPEEEEFETLGGLVADRLERIPRVGDKIELLASDRRGHNHKFVLQVERMDGRRVDRLCLRLIEENIELAEEEIKE